MSSGAIWQFDSVSLFYLIATSLLFLLGCDAMRCSKVLVLCVHQFETVPNERASRRYIGEIERR